MQERAQELLELPGAVELALGIHAGERGEGRGLALGQVAGVSEHGVFQALHRLRGRLVLRSPGLVPQPFPDVFCQVVIGQCGVSFPSEKAVGFSPVRNWPVIARVLLFHCIRA